MITVVTGDSLELEVGAAVVEHSEFLRHLLEDVPVRGSITLPNVDAQSLRLIVEYCEHNGAFLSTLSNEVLFKLVLAANYLNMRALLDDACENVAERIRGRTPQEIRTIFGY